MKTYISPKSAVIEMNVESVILAGSVPGPKVGNAEFDSEEAVLSNKKVWGNSSIWE